MIRIDLGKDELQKPSKKIKSVSFGKLGFGKLGGLNKISADLGTVVMIGAALGLPVMAHLFFMQFRSYLMKQHEARMRDLQEKTDVVNVEVTKLQPLQKELESYE